MRLLRARERGVKACCISVVKARTSPALCPKRGITSNGLILPRKKEPRRVSARIQHKLSEG